VPQVQSVRLGLLVLLVPLVRQELRVERGILAQQVLPEVQVAVAQLVRLGLMEALGQLVVLEPMGSKVQLDHRELPAVLAFREAQVQQDLAVLLVQLELQGQVEKQVLLVLQGHLETLDRPDHLACKAQQVW